MKAFRIKLAFRFFAIIDVIFAERFDLRIYKNGVQTAKTTFCRKEIDKCVLNIESEKKEQVPFEFIEWYSGMEKQKILNAYKRWQKEKG
jgi:hypothetical protein